MAVSLTSELYAALYAALLGLLLSLLWDAFSVVRILFGLYDAPRLPARLLSLRFPFLAAPLFGGQAKKSKRVRSAALFLLDFAYALAAGIAFVLFLYAFHDGVFRLFLLAAATLSFTLYRFSLGRLVFLTLGTVAFLLRVLLSYLALAVKLPVAIVGRTLLYALRTLGYLFLRLLLRAVAPALTRLSLSSARRGGDAFLSACTK